MNSYDSPSACLEIMRQPWPLFWRQIFQEEVELERDQLREQKTAHTCISVVLNVRLHIDNQHINQQGQTR